MTQKRPDLPSNSIWPTFLILTIYATAAAFAGVILTFAGNAFAVSMMTGPFGWYAYGPTLVMKYTQIANISLIATPLWAFFAGRYFARHSSSKHGNAVADMNVTFFSDTHEISVVTQKLAERMGLPRIAHIGWFPGDEINAFAMGTRPDNALIAVSRGAVERLSKKELIAVLAHELGHVASQDMARMTYARGIQDVFTFFLIFKGLQTTARWVFTPLSELEILRLSRAREYTADRIAAMMIGAENMISALEKLLNEEKQPPKTDYANVMMWSGFGGGHLLSTHPPLERRIARLKQYQVSSQPARSPEGAPLRSPAE